jgi:uncharacterized SAM-binding protein YcdF (DUF218 family)
MSRLEAEYPPVAIETMRKADVAIVTGGAVGQPLPPRLAADLGGAADRVFHAARILRAGKASHILVVAGNLPWLPAAASEAELIRELLVEFGVPDEVIVLETESRNTHENAVNAAAVFGEHGWESGLLVTSGAHIPRALAAFRRAGAEVTPAATDIQATRSTMARSISCRRSRRWRPRRPRLKSGLGSSSIAIAAGLDTLST